MLRQKPNNFSKEDSKSQIKSNTSKQGEPKDSLNSSAFVVKSVHSKKNSHTSLGKKRQNSRCNSGCTIYGTTRGNGQGSSKRDTVKSAFRDYCSTFRTTSESKSSKYVKNSEK